MDGPAYESTHQLLLGLAGHVDDDLLGWVRELVAVGEEARAISLVTAGVVAERIRLPGPVRAALVDAGRAARSGIDPVELAPAAEPTVEHRFAAAPTGATDVATAVRALPARQLQGTTVHLAWRLTPAGTAPGPLPHPVVLVEIDPGRHSGEMLAYLVASGLARGGVHASVEVVAAGQAHTAYHEAALAAAAPVAVGGTAEAGLATAPFPVRHSRPEIVEEPSVEVEEPVAEEPEAVPATAVTEPVRIVDATRATVPSAAAEDDSDDRRSDIADVDDIEDIDDDAAEEDVEVEPEPVLDPNERHPFADDPVGPAPVARRRPVDGVPALSALSDPLSDPLSEPLMAPLLDPTIHAHDPLGVDHLVGPSRHPFAPAEPPPAPAPVPDPAPEPAAAVPEPVQERHRRRTGDRGQLGGRVGLRHLGDARRRSGRRAERPADRGRGHRRAGRGVRRRPRRHPADPDTSRTRPSGRRRSHGRSNRCARARHPCSAPSCAGPAGSRSRDPRHPLPGGRRSRHRPDRNPRARILRARTRSARSRPASATPTGSCWPACRRSWWRGASRGPHAVRAAPTGGRTSNGRGPNRPENPPDNAS